MKQQRKVSNSLTVNAFGKSYDVSQVPGILLGEVVRVEPAEQGLLVSRMDQPVHHVAQPLASGF